MFMFMGGSRFIRENIGVIARSEATKQSRDSVQDVWIASLRSQ
jgi:hypothetical protein